MTNLDFDPQSVEPAADFDTIPAGEYVAVIEADERKTANSGNGDYLALTLQIVDGKYAGRKIWHNLNLWNSNEQAATISQRQLRSICDAVGIRTQLKDSGELHGKPMTIVVRHRMWEGQPRAEVKSFKTTTETEVDDSGYGEKITDQTPPTPAEVSADAPWGASK